MTSKYISIKSLWAIDYGKYHEIVIKDNIYDIRLNFMASAKVIKEYDILDANEELISIIDQETLDTCFLSMSLYRENQIKSILD